MTRTTALALTIALASTSTVDFDDDFDGLGQDFLDMPGDDELTLEDAAAADWLLATSFRNLGILEVSARTGRAFDPEATVSDAEQVPYFRFEEPMTEARAHGIGHEPCADINGEFTGFDIWG